MPGRSNSFETRCRARIRSPRGIFPGPDQTPGGFLPGTRDGHLSDLIQFQQPGQVQGVVPVRFHPVPGRALQFGRSRDHTVDTGAPQEPGQRETCRSGLVNHPARARQAPDPGQNLSMIRRQPAPENLTGLTIDRARNNRQGVDIQADVSTLVHSWNLQTSNVALPQWIKSGNNPREIEEKVPAPPLPGPSDRGHPRRTGCRTAAARKRAMHQSPRSGTARRQWTIRRASTPARPQPLRHIV